VICCLLLANNKQQTTTGKNRGVTMPKPDIHPKWYPEAKVYCNGEVVMTVGSTRPELHVDVWSGNHPFFTGTQKMIDTEGRVERFMRKYGMLDDGASAKQSESKEK
jgi:large subunit ribosomal protein L31